MIRLPRSPVLAMLLFASTLTVMAGSTIAPVLEVIRGDLGVSGTAAGLIITAHGLAIAVSSPPIGRLIDRWGFRRPLAAGLLLYGVAGAAGIFVTTYPALIASRLLFGVGAAAVFSSTTVALLELYRGPERDRVMGWRGLVAAAAAALLVPGLMALRVADPEQPRDGSTDASARVSAVGAGTRQ